MRSFLSDVSKVSSHCRITEALKQKSEKKIQRLLVGIFGFRRGFKINCPKGEWRMESTEFNDVKVVSDVSIS